MTKTHTHSAADSVRQALEIARDYLIEEANSGAVWGSLGNAKALGAIEDALSDDNGWYGMTLRDYFASKALPHALARTRALIDRYGDKAILDHVPNAAREAYRIADSMLKARSA